VAGLEQIGKKANSAAIQMSHPVDKAAGQKEDSEEMTIDLAESLLNHMM
jgi:hypothetical protein